MSAASKKTVSRRERGEGKAAMAHNGPKTTVQSGGQEPIGPSGWSLSGFRTYLQQVRLEMGRVTWPTRSELQAATIVVMMTLLVFSAYLGVLDKILVWVFP